MSRLPVEEASVPWARPSPAYSPPDFTAPFVLTAAWADPDIGQQGFNPQWNTLGTNNSYSGYIN